MEVASDDEEIIDDDEPLPTIVPSTVQVMSH